MKRTLFALPVAALLLLISGCSDEPEQKEPEPQARAVTVAQIELRNVAGSFSASGLLLPREEAAVGTELSGYRVSRVLVEEGDYVKQGQTLAVLDGTLLEGQVAQARASVAQAQAQAAQAISEANRVKGLDGTGVLAGEAIEARRFQARSARAATAASQSQLNSLLTQRGRLAIRAPVSGRVLERMVRPGDIANSGQIMFRVARSGQIELDAEVPEDVLKGVSVGDNAEVKLSSGTTLVGSVRLISPRIDPQTKLGRVRIRMPQDDELRAGGYASATISLPEQPVAAVPEKAVQFEASGPQLTIIGKDNKAKRMEIKTGARADGFVALEEGPPAGTWVALGGGAFLLDGDLVKPIKQKPALRKAPTKPEIETTPSGATKP